MKIKIITRGGSAALTYEDEAPVQLLTAVAAAMREIEGAYFYAPCGGGGSCGKCKVRCSGALSALTREEREKLTPEEIADGVRLACRAYAEGDVLVRLEYGEAAAQMTGEIYGGAIIEAGTETVILSEPPKESFLAVDIGTTTVAAALYEKSAEGGYRVKKATAINPQTACGADVIARISYAESEDGLIRLRDMINGCIDAMADKLGHRPKRAVFVGNTVMLHLFSGLDVSGIGRAPFTPASLFGGEYNGAILPRCISGYVGADAVSAALAAGMGTNGDIGELLCDMGTNGEILYMRGGVLKCCSTAAGPALEGAGISCGMIAADGAVDRAETVNGSLRLHVIGEGKARGICGSGLIDVTACLLELGIIEPDGYMEDRYELCDGVFITPADIRAIQLAKGAIRAGIEVMLDDNIDDNIDCGKDDSGRVKVDRFYISGGFGAGMNIASCVKIGLIPPQLADKVVYIGNGALAGAVMMGCDDNMLRREYELADNAVYTELSLDAGFTEKFIEYLNF